MSPGICGRRGVIFDRSGVMHVTGHFWQKGKMAEGGVAWGNTWGNMNVSGFRRSFGRRGVMHVAGHLEVDL